MPDLLLELFSEEIPARMQAKAADDLRRMVTDKLVAEGLVYEGAKAFATPRRLTLTVHGIPARQSDLKEERKGPRVGGPDAAIAGFLKATGLASLDEAKIQRDPKKGDFYIALIEKPGRATLDVLADMLPVIVRTFPWPKSMRWGERSARPGALQLGAAAAFHRRDVRHRDRRAGGGEIRHRRHRGRADHLWPPLHGAGARFPCAASRITRRSLHAAKVVLDPAAPQGHHSGRRQAAGVRARLRTGRGSGAARRGRGPGRMAGGADGIVRAGIFVDPGRSDPRHHPQ